MVDEAVDEEVNSGSVSLVDLCHMEDRLFTTNGVVDITSISSGGNSPFSIATSATVPVIITTLLSPPCFVAINMCVDMVGVSSLVLPILSSGIS